MKIALIFGKGIDGCGVTRGARIFEQWANDNGVAETAIINFDNGQDMARAKLVKWTGKIHHVSSNDKDVSPEILKVVNDCDIAIVHSYPTRKQDACHIERFRRFLEKVQDPIVVCHDHAISKVNMTAIPQASELYAMSDIFVPQSMSGLSSKTVRMFDSGMNGRILENPIWIDTKYLDTFRKSAEDREKHMLYIGRHSPLKDPAMLCRMRPHLPDWKMSFVGCERSISSVSLPPGSTVEKCRCSYIPEYQPMIRFMRLNSAKKYVPAYKGEDTKDASMTAYDAYEFDWGMNVLGSSFASWCGYSLSDTNEYGSRMEYTMIESFLLSMPILNDEFTENAFSPDGKKWKDYDFLISSSNGKEKQLAEQLAKLWENKKEWQDRSMAGRGLIQHFNSIDTLAPNYLAAIQKMGKRSNKVNGIDRISEYFPQARELRADGEIVMSHASSVKNQLSLILVDGRQEEYVAKANSVDLSSFFD